MGIFSTAEGPCGIFAQRDWCGGQGEQAITFLRAASLVTHTAPVQNTAGEVLLSFVEIGTWWLTAQPIARGWVRLPPGQLDKADIQLFGAGHIPLQEGHWCLYEGQRMEVDEVLHFMQHHTEIGIVQLGVVEDAMDEHERLAARVERIERLYADRVDLLNALDRKLTERITGLDQRVSADLYELKNQIALLNVRSGWTNTLISVLALLLSGLITLVVIKR